MDINRAKQVGEELMRKNLDLPMFWHLEFSNSRRTFGCCQFKKLVFKGTELTLPDGVIIPSKPLVEWNPESELRDTILHEIAHALCGPGVGHSKAWKETAKRLGCRPQTCFDSTQVILPPRRYIAKCPNCGRQREFDAIKVISCGRCDNKKYNPKYRMVFRNNPRALQIDHNDNTALSQLSTTTELTHGNTAVSNR